MGYDSRDGKRDDQEKSPLWTKTVLGIDDVEQSGTAIASVHSYPRKQHSKVHSSNVVCLVCLQHSKAQY